MFQAIKIKDYQLPQCFLTYLYDYNINCAVLIFYERYDLCFSAIYIIWTVRCDGVIYSSSFGMDCLSIYCVCKIVVPWNKACGGSCRSFGEIDKIEE